ncbi:hypothetical protein WOLCODRAFT_167402 [Wolfiporia cocos MD-104 SS10]|uniref:Uncharacterized protein n=1 Tax=Wolfiporia cocos (strain MD-104) TaxID=742152 RepID=A0A2H3J6H1_WOLCO|nr:hypothetical protein WOLCODRAFT_167402 [Wolfiporia cocos MD-104 SS10]
MPHNPSVSSRESSPSDDPVNAEIQAESAYSEATARSPTANIPPPQANVLASPWRWSPHAYVHPNYMPYHPPPTVHAPYSFPSSSSAHPSSTPVFDIPTLGSSPPSRSLSAIESLFVDEVFKDFTLPEISSVRSLSGWYTKLEIEDRVLLIFRCMRSLGFDTLGDLFAACLGNSYSKHPTVYHTIAAFVRSRGAVGKQPVDIINIMYSHPKARDLDNRKPIPPTFPSLPRHALPPSHRVAEDRLAVIPLESTQNQLLDWSLKQVLECVEREADMLTRSSTGAGLTVERGDSLSWD